MRIRNTNLRAKNKTKLQMTPMIDIVFQLLVFFVMTFTIVAIEGDFNIRMPRTSANVMPPMDLPIVIALRADAEGELTHAVMDDLQISGDTTQAVFAQMRRRVRAQVPDAGGPGREPSQQEVEFDCDYNLKYKYVIDAITAVSGYVDDDNRVKKVIEKIKFTKQRDEPVG